MKYCVYILFSEKLNKYYIGETTDLKVRIEQHNEGYFKNSFSSATADWVLFHHLVCETRKQAVNVEKHIKRMKSKKYLEDLKKYPVISEKLLIKYY